MVQIPGVQIPERAGSAVVGIHGIRRRAETRLCTVRRSLAIVSTSEDNQKLVTNSRIESIDLCADNMVFFASDEIGLMFAVDNSFPSWVALSILIMARPVAR